MYIYSIVYKIPVLLPIRPERGWLSYDPCISMSISFCFHFPQSLKFSGGS